VTDRTQRSAIRRRRRLAALLLIVAIAPLALLASKPSVAIGHAVLVRSSPESQVALADPPPVIDLWFSEPLEPDFSSFELFASDGSALELVGMRVDPSDATHLSALTRGLGPGVFTVVYRTLSTRDGHEWAGSMTFTVLNEDGTIPLGTSFAPDLSTGTTSSEVTGRWMVFAAFAVLAGGTLVSLLAAISEGDRGLGPLARRAGRLSVRLGIAALPLAVGGSVLQLMARQDALGGSAIDLLTDTRFGTILLWRLLALLAVAAAPGLALIAAKRRRHRTEQILGTIAAASTLGGIVTISLLSHAAAAPGSFWATLGDTAHLVLATAWAGGLLVMALLLVQLRRSEARRPSRHGNVEVGTLVSGFSLFATGALGILAATGLLRTVGEVPTADALFNTEYGDWLLIKLGLLLLPLAFALSSRSVLARWRRGAIEPAELSLRLRNLLVIEAALAIAVLGTVAVLGQVPTPRGDTIPAASSRAAFTDVNLIEVVDDLTIHLQVSPALVGSNELRVHLYHVDGSDIGEVERVQLELSAVGLAANAGGDTIEPSYQGADVYIGTAALSSLGAEWSVDVDVRRAGLDDARLDFTVPIQLDGATIEAPDSFGSPAPQLSRNFLWALLLLPVGATLLLIGVSRSGDRGRDERPRGRRRRGQPVAGGAASKPASRRFPRPSFRVAGTAAVFAAIVLAVSGSPHSHGGQLLENPLRDDPASIVRGAEIYGANCASCHGTEGRGDGPLALTLTPAPADLSLHVPLHPEGDTYIFIANGFPNTSMPAWADQLTEEEIWDVVNFLRNEFDPQE